MLDQQNFSFRYAINYRLSIVLNSKSQNFNTFLAAG